MTYLTNTPAVAFSEARLLASGPLVDVVQRIKAACDQDPDCVVLVFDARTSQPIELDLRGSLDDCVRRLAQPVADQDAAKGRGRPKLGVTAREVTLLPRHWDWLATQPGGASVTLRKLVEDARRADEGPQKRRDAQAATYRFMVAVAGNLHDFDEVSRALFANRQDDFRHLIKSWPSDVRNHVEDLSQEAFLP